MLKEEYAEFRQSPEFVRKAINCCAQSNARGRDQPKTDPPGRGNPGESRDRRRGSGGVSADQAVIHGLVGRFAYWSPQSVKRFKPI
jgi:hypothetical protein